MSAHGRVGRVDEFLDALERVADGGAALAPEVVAELLILLSGLVPDVDGLG